MKVLFVVSPYLIQEKKYKLRSFVAFPYGVLSIASYLKKNTEHEVRVFDCNVKEDWSHALVAEITLHKPDIVAISMMFDNSYKYLREISFTSKYCTNQKALVVLGGAATKHSYKQILDEQPAIDAICYGEGELPMFTLVGALSPEAVLETTLCWITREKKESPVEVTIDNLDEIIDIDYSLIPSHYLNSYQMEEAFSPFTRDENKKQFFMVGSRGCPFKCSFCMNSKSTDKRVRHASVDKIIEHVKHLVTYYKMNVLTFYDDQILFDTVWAKELFKKLIPFKLRIEMPNGVSVAYIDDELAGLMKQAGVDTLYLAIESGSPHVLNKLIKKPLTIDKAKNVIEILHKHKFWLLGYFVVGMPGETDEHRKETLKFIYDTGLDWCSFTTATPVKGSKLYDECIEKGYIESGTTDIGKYEWVNAIINTPEYSAEYIAEQTYLMNLEANFVNNYRMRTGEYELAAKTFRKVWEKHPDHVFAHTFYAKAISCMEPKWNKYFEHFSLWPLEEV